MNVSLKDKNNPMALFNDYKRRIMSGKLKGNNGASAEGSFYSLLLSQFVYKCSQGLPTMAVGLDTNKEGRLNSSRKFFFWNPDFVEAIDAMDHPENENFMYFVFAHECLHFIMRHFVRRIDYLVNQSLEEGSEKYKLFSHFFNIVADWEINNYCVEQGLVRYNKQVRESWVARLPLAKCLNKKIAATVEGIEKDTVIGPKEIEALHTAGLCAVKVYAVPSPCFPSDMGKATGKAWESYMNEILRDYDENPEDLKHQMMQMHGVSEEQLEQMRNSGSGGNEGEEQEGENSDGNAQGNSDGQGSGKQKAQQDIQAIIAGNISHQVGDSSMQRSLTPGEGTGQTFEELAEMARELEEETADTLKKTYDSMSEKERGSLPGSFKSIINAARPGRTISWEKELETAIKTGAATFRTKSMRRVNHHKVSLNRRIGKKMLCEFPGKIQNYAPKILLAVDTSGSVSDSELAYIVGETYNIATAVESELWIAQVDWDLQDIFKCENPKDFSRREVKGRGGTRFDPGFEKAKEMQVDLFIYYTDGECSLPAPELRVPPNQMIWLLSEHGNPWMLREENYGRLIRVKP